MAMAMATVTATNKYTYLIPNLAASPRLGTGVDYNS